MTHQQSSFADEDLTGAIDSVAEQLNGGSILTVFIFILVLALTAGGYIIFSIFFATDLVNCVYLPLCAAFLLALTPEAAIPRLTCGWIMTALITIIPFFLWAQNCPKSYLLGLIAYLAWTGTSVAPAYDRKLISSTDPLCRGISFFTPDFWTSLYDGFLYPGHYVWNTLFATIHAVLSNEITPNTVKKSAKKIILEKPTTIRTYTPSGAVSLNIIFFTAIVTFFEIGTGWTYYKICKWNNWEHLEKLPNTLTFYIKNLTLRFMEWGSFAFLLITIVIAVVICTNLGKCRNPLLGLLLGLWLGFVPILARHYFPCKQWITTQIQQTSSSPSAPAPPVLSVKIFKIYFTHLATTGFPAVLDRSDNADSPQRVTGWSIYAVFIMEALCALAVGMAFGYSTSANPFDESSGEWMQAKTIATINTPEFEVIRIKEAKNIATILDLPYDTSSLKNDITHTLTYDIYEGKRNGQQAVLNIQHTTTQISENGGKAERTEPLWNNVLLSRVDNERLKKAAKSIIMIPSAHR